MSRVYNIYSREDDEPYLALIGNTAEAYYDTTHNWAENSSIKTRIYAVSAVKADGTESFLFDMVENNDRDHDGLTDEKKTSLGTDVNKPDTDGDGLNDGEEYIYGTNPLLIDTDGTVTVIMLRYGLVQIHWIKILSQHPHHCQR